ncbi:hypothetical protein PGH07_09600 [Sulfurovum sp. zt1-1]|uniref:Uncharacterized protein n=1 Tax=Sulfurovum zhangzhouensis TaxID=3019067 RepID=A0ABT7R012_9BACT|nr:hypothetical protein [Sulfurovum zhangzhouensis]MDM5272433.1 hypothetical protein [Sulfurovum zhangzhouensis]
MQFEPSLESLEDYRGKERIEKRLTVWLVILSGLLLGAIYSIITLNNVSPGETVEKHDTSGISKY